MTFAFIALIVTAGQDKVIMVHSLDPAIKGSIIIIYSIGIIVYYYYYIEPLHRYTGHTGSISSIIYQCNQLLSVSWDRYSIFIIIIIPRPRIACTRNTVVVVLVS